MFAFVGEHKAAFIFSVAFHAAAAAVLMLSLKMPSKPPVLPAPIQGVLVDQSVLKREQQRREQVASAERERTQRVERERREAVEHEKQEKLAVEQRERDRVAEQKREQERKDQAERDKAEATKKEQEKLAQEKRDQEAREKREREEAVKRQQVARAQQQREQELADALATEDAVRSSSQAEYDRLVVRALTINFHPPLSTPRDLECEVSISQLPNREVADVRIGRCNGDDAVHRAIVAAVKAAQPLPAPPPPLPVARNINVTFAPRL